VGADLHRTIARVGNAERDRRATAIELDLAVVDEKLAWDHDTTSPSVARRSDEFMESDDAR
jgi:hypothetical protein